MLGPLRRNTPRRIGPYEVLARLGAGGMGEVFLGRDGAADSPTDSPAAGPVAGTFVAVKTVRQDVAGSPAFRDRFRREIRVAALVDSPYAAAPLGGDADAEVPWLATAYVPGPSLSQAVRRGGALPVATVRALGADVARALADLHRAGVLHRDLKPGNVMLSVDGPRLIDFGIARSDTATTMTATGLMVGTPSFMSPEHVAGARRVTAASDVFCLGSLLCYAATGEDPFGDGPLAAVLYRVSQAEADLSRVPDELRGTVAACLALDPAARPTPEALAELLGGGAPKVFPWPEGVRDHIGEYGTELARLVASGGPLLEVAPAAGPVVTPAAPGLHSVPTFGPVAPPAAPPRARRRRALAAALALAVVAGGLGAYLLWPEDGKPPRAPAKAAPAAAPRVPGVDDRGLADASGVVPQNAAQRPAGWKPWRAKLTAPAFGCSAGEKVLVCRTTDGRYEALDPASGRKLWDVPRAADTPGETYLSPKGGFPFTAGAATRPTVHGGSVALVAGGSLQVRDARTGAVRWEKPAHGPQGASFETRPLVADGIVFAATAVVEDVDWVRSALTAFSLADGERLWSKELTNGVISFAERKAYEPVAHAQGVVYALGQGGLVAYDGRKGTPLGQVEPDAKACEKLKVLGTSAYCAGVGEGADAALHLLDARTLAPKGSLPGALGTALPTAVGPRAVVSWDKGLRILDPRTGEERASFPSVAAPSGLAQSWSSPLLAGDQVVYADHSSLYTVRLGADGTPDGLKVTRVPGAPGPRVAEEDFDLEYGYTISKRVREPEVLPVGGIAYVVYDKGAVASVALPK
ncbi:PQQ-binding-like beta-propeller repeat protein [Streptomyces sp. NPDC058664]|uniref:protein kinase domain-containing protein n=1 Tax=unclassified Streptomyces TaxID=2593676 RepID=UPI003669E1B2